MVTKATDGSTPSPPAHNEAEVFQDPRLEGIRQAAERGDENAQVALGWIYSSGKGIPVDKVKAAGWYRLAAEKGDLRAQVALGWLYFDGQGCGRNLQESAVWYGKAAARGNIKARQMLRKIRRLVH
jgi:aryl-alcohol dehydrogenase-like predicted oxidoreductase